MNTLQRRSTIAQRLSEEHAVGVVELARELGVSGMTVRRDLAELERQGFARRIHGGAVRETQRSFEPSVLARYTTCAEEKQRIVRSAISLLKSGDSIAVDIGSTMLFFAEELRDTPDLRLIILTPSLAIAGELSDNPAYVLIVSGGVVRRGELSLTGDTASEAFCQYNVDKLFLSVAGIDSRKGLTEFNMEDAVVKRAMIQSANQVIALVDSSKFEKIALCTIGGLDMIDVLVTDRMPEGTLKDQLDQHGTRIIVAPTSK